MEEMKLPSQKPVPLLPIHRNGDDLFEEVKRHHKFAKELDTEGDRTLAMQEMNVAIELASHAKRSYLIEERPAQVETMDYFLQVLSQDLGIMEELARPPPSPLVYLNGDGPTIQEEFESYLEKNLKA